MLYSIKTGDDGNMVKTKSTANYRPNWGGGFVTRGSSRFRASTYSQSLCKPLVR